MNLTTIKKTTTGLALAAALGTTCWLGSVGCNPTWYDGETYFTEKKGYISSRAKFVSEGVGEQRYVAPDDGKLFLLDPTQVEGYQTDKSLNPMYNFLMQKGQEFVVNPAKGYVSVDDDRTEIKLYPDHTYKIYYQVINADKP